MVNGMVILATDTRVKIRSLIFDKTSRSDLDITKTFNKKFNITITYFNITENFFFLLFFSFFNNIVNITVNFYM